MSDHCPHCQATPGLRLIRVADVVPGDWIFQELGKPRILQRLLYVEEEDSYMLEFRGFAALWSSKERVFAFSKDWNERKGEAIALEAQKFLGEH